MIKIKGEAYFDEVLKYKTTPYMDSVFKRLTRPIDQLLSSDVYNCLILNSEGGLGKTATTIRHLTLKGMQQGKDYILHTGKRTTIEIVRLLVEHNKALHVFDDVNILTSDQDVIPFLKQAMQRGVLSYKSKVTDIPATPFLGKTIILCNNLPNGLDIEALKQRCLIPFIHFSHEEKLGILGEFVKVDTLFPDLSKGIKAEVVDYIEELTEKDKGLNFRLFKLGCDTAKSFGEDWKEVFDSYYRSTLDLLTIAQNVDLEGWLKEGYGSRRNYYYLRRK